MLMDTFIDGDNPSRIDTKTPEWISLAKDAFDFSSKSQEDRTKSFVKLMSTTRVRLVPKGTFILMRSTCSWSWWWGLVLILILWIFIKIGGRLGVPRRPWKIHVIRGIRAFYKKIESSEFNVSFFILVENEILNNIKMGHFNQLSILRLENGILHVQWQGEWALATQKGPTESSSLPLCLYCINIILM